MLECARDISDKVSNHRRAATCCTRGREDFAPKVAVLGDGRDADRDHALPLPGTKHEASAVIAALLYLVTTHRCAIMLLLNRPSS